MNRDLLRMIPESDRNRRAALALSVQADLDTLRNTFARTADRHKLLLDALIGMGIENLTVLGGPDITLADLTLEDETP